MTQPTHVSGTIKTITPFDLADKDKTVESVWSMDDIKEAAEYLKNGMGFSEFALRQFSEAVLGILADHKTPASDPQPALRDMDAPQTETSSEAGELLPFTAEVGAYSGVVGSSVHLIAPDGRFMGRIAFMCQDDALREKSQQVRMSEIIADALNRRALPAYAKLKEETK